MKQNAKAALAADGAFGATAYYESAHRFPILSHKEETDLARRWRDHQDPAAAEKIVNCHLRYVIAIAMKYRGYGAQIDDLIAEGNMGLLRALDRFDPERGFRFSTYAGWWIRAALNDYVMHEASIVKTGTTPDQKKLFFRLRGAKARLGIYDDNDLTREAAEKIATDLCVNVEEVIRMNRRVIIGDSSLNKPASKDGIDGIHLLPSSDPLPDESLVLKRAQELNKEIVQIGLASLTDRERDIVVRRHLIDDTMTLEDLGQVYGVSRERIRQVEKKAFEKFTKAVRRYAKLRTAA